MNKEGAKRTVLLILLVSLLLNGFAANTSLAAGEPAKRELFYEDMKNEIETHSGVRVETPYPNFFVKADGKEVGREKWSSRVIYDQMENPYIDRDIPVSATVKVGTKLEAISFSEPGVAGAKVINHDWQMAYWNLDQKHYEGAYRTEITARNKFTQVADKPGYIIFYLNVADNQKFYYKGTNKRLEYANWSDRGMRKVHGAYIDGANFRVKDWYYTPIKIRVVEGDDNMVMKELEVIDPETNKVINSYKRELNPEDPFDVSKQTISRLKEDGKEYVEKGKTYKVRAKYQYISFTEGKFNINDPSSMSEKQKLISTEIDRNEVLAKVALDNKLASEDIKISKDKPNKRLMNLEEASFEWDYKVPLNVSKTVKIKPVVTKLYDSKNMIKEDDYAELTFRVKSNDIAAKAPVLLLDKSNNTTTMMKMNEPQNAIISFQNIVGDTTIGTDDKTNPKLTVDLVVTDKNGKVLVQETVRTEKLMKPNDVITFKTSKFTPTTSEIRVCGTVNKIHNQLGHNSDESNDKICRTFTVGAPDIGMKGPVTLKSNGKPIPNVQVGGNHQVEFILKHYSGTETVGTDIGNNKRVRVNVTVSDGNNVIMRETVIADKPLKPGEEMPIRPKGNFVSETGKIIACAEVDEAHAKLGYNIANANDKICQAFSTVKNYSVNNVNVTPSSINLGETDRNTTTPATIYYTVGHEEAAQPGDKSLNPNPEVEIKHNGRVIWRGTVRVGVNSQSRESHTANINFSEGANNFTVEVNPRRNEIEFKPEMSNPYSDNKASATVNVKRNNQCVDCNWKHTRNRWDERFEWREWYNCHIEVSYSKSGKRRERCVCDRRSWEETHSFYENFTIDQVDFRSKHSKDNKGGWTDVKNYKTGKIKSGYGFELRVFTKYETNRHNEPRPHPYGPNGRCSDELRRSPRLSPAYNRENVYLKMPYGDSKGKDVCYILENVNYSGPWYNRRNEFQIRSRVTPSGERERKIFIKEHSKPGTHTLELTTSRVNGYEPDSYYFEGGTKKQLQDCNGFKIQILPQDDMKTHITQ